MPRPTPTEPVKLMAAMPSDQTQQAFCSIFLKRTGTVGDKRYSRVGVVSVAWPVKPHELPGWIDRRLRELGLRAAPDAVQGLA